jgi:hypothetical protein
VGQVGGALDKAKVARLFSGVYLNRAVVADLLFSLLFVWKIKSQTRRVAWVLGRGLGVAWVWLGSWVWLGCVKAWVRCLGCGLGVSWVWLGCVKAWVRCLGCGLGVSWLGRVWGVARKFSCGLGVAWK